MVPSSYRSGHCVPTQHAPLPTRGTLPQTSDDCHLVIGTSTQRGRHLLRGADDMRDDQGGQGGSDDMRDDQGGHL